MRGRKYRIGGRERKKEESEKEEDRVRGREKKKEENEREKERDSERVSVT